MQSHRLKPALKPGFWRRLFSILAVFAAVLGLYLYSLAQGPDRELMFNRDLPSPLPPALLTSYLSDVKLWPDWFYTTTSAQILTDEKNPEGTGPRTLIRPGDRIRLEIDPKKGPWKHFEILLQVTQYEPAHLLKLKFLHDSKGKIDRLFDHLDWEIELAPRAIGGGAASGSVAAPNSSTAGGSWIRARALAHTCNWRSRLMGAIAERILMAQAFYPNVIALSEKGANMQKAGGGLFPD